MSRHEPAVPRWLLTVIAAVAFLLWVVGYVAEFVSTLTGGDFHAPEGAFALVMLVVGSSLAADKLFERGRKVAEAAAQALRDEGEAQDDTPTGSV